jgi:tetratricopeptide (TPR) repeat protein
VLAHFEPVDYDRALSLIDEVLAKSKNEDRFHSTKGHILYKMGRYQDALPELEIAKRAYPDDLNLFTVLTETCEKLGYKMQAEAYRKRAEEIKARTASRLTVAPDKQPAEGPKDPPAAQPKDGSPSPPAAPANPEAKPSPAKTPAPPGGGPQKP